MMGSLLTAILLGSGRIPQEADNRLCENWKVCYFSKYTSMNLSMSLDMKILIKYDHKSIYSIVLYVYKFTTIFSIVLYSYLRLRRVLYKKILWTCCRLR